jgi:hypothetical protein
VAQVALQVLVDVAGALVVAQPEGDRVVLVEEGAVQPLDQAVEVRRARRQPAVADPAVVQCLAEGAPELASAVGRDCVSSIPAST